MRVRGRVRASGSKNEPCGLNRFANRYNPVRTVSARFTLFEVPQDPRAMTSTRPRLLPGEKTAMFRSQR